MLYDKSAVLALKRQYQALAHQNPPESVALGAFCTPKETVFRLWSPLAHSVSLCLYPDQQILPMEKDSWGVWSVKVAGDLHGTGYTYRIDHGNGPQEAGDPYAFAVDCNSRHCLAVDLSRTNPPDWEQDRPPRQPPETVIYELHIKEFSWQEASGVPAPYRGRYKAFTCAHTTLHGDGVHPTGLDYLADLGVTHVQLMPAYDYGSVDDTDPTQFNWGYDPLYYNVPEGSYATDPNWGRIREFKEMVQTLHRKGFRVIMDVVYNHTYSLDSVFNQVVPWYYYRTDEEGIPSNGSACGNDFASEMPMAGRFILDSVLYWAREYHIDGFRFDLMGLLDTDLMNRIRSRLDAIYGPGEKLLFGEPWSADETAMQPGSIPALKANIGLLDRNIGMFSDDIRDSIRGHVFDADVRGFVAGREGLEKDILECVRAFPNSQVKAPSQIISYVSAHDNHTLWDRLGYAFPDQEARLRANRLAAAMYMTCQGHLFLLSGEEFGRTKNNLDNTYNESIELNRLDWERAWEFKALREYYRGLIALRKQCPGLCDKSPNQRVQNPEFRPGAIRFYVDNGDSPWERLCILYNRNDSPEEFPLEEGRWEVLADGTDSFLWQHPVPADALRGEPGSALILGLRTKF